jgi:hypothetical protein
MPDATMSKMPHQPSRLGVSPQTTKPTMLANRRALYRNGAISDRAQEDDRQHRDDER